MSAVKAYQIYIYHAIYGTDGVYAVYPEKLPKSLFAELAEASKLDFVVLDHTEEELWVEKTY